MLLDDIVTLLDDIAVMSKIAAKKSAGILGDDLALNAEQVVGIRADRELPVVWAVAKGSLLNKLILIPLALLIGSWASWLIKPLLMVGGLYLCFEGVEKIIHKLLTPKAAIEAEKAELRRRVGNDDLDLVQEEKEKIQSAIKTDFVLSAEIVVLTLGLVEDVQFLNQLGVLLAVGFLMTIGVYGLVAAMVKIDDLGLYLLKTSVAWYQSLGKMLLVLAPKLMVALSILGTAAMFLVGGGIFIHAISYLHHLQELSQAFMGIFGGLLFEGIVGILGGGLAFVGVKGFERLRA